jgi:SOS response regulatory protein OraA/RecX
MVTVDADPDALYIGKELLESKQLKAISSLDDSTRHWLYARALPSFGTLRDGVYRLPLALVDQIDEGLEEFQKRRQRLINQFGVRYPELVNAARIRLRALYNPGDYPPVDQVLTRFTFAYRYLSFMTPESLSVQLLARERVKAAAEVASEVEEIKLALRASFAELINHATERLGSRPDGKKQVFRDSLVANLEEFFTYFQARNLVNDQELAELVERARSVMQGVAAEELRSNDLMRGIVRERMEQIKGEMDRNLMVRPSRRLILDREAIKP